MTITVNKENGTFEGKQVVKVNDKEFVIEVVSNLINGAYLECDWKINNEIYHRSYIKLSEAKEHLQIFIDSIEKVIIVAERLGIPVIAGDYSLEYVDDVLLAKEINFENGVAKDLMNDFLEHHTLDNLPEGSLEQGEIIYYSGIMDTEAEETSFGMELIGYPTDEYDAYVDEVNFFDEDNGRLESVKSCNDSTELSEVLKEFKVLIDNKTKKKLIIQHVMDEEPREMTLDNAFLEALELSGGNASDIEVQESMLLEYLKKFPDFIKNISEEYKMSVLEGWDYEILN